MRSFTSVFLLLALSSSVVYGAQNLEAKNTKRSSFIEKRQDKAREIRKDNYNSIELSDKTTPEKANFGFQKAVEEGNSKL